MIERRPLSRPLSRIGYIPMAIGGTGLVIPRKCANRRWAISFGPRQQGSLTQSAAGDSPLIAGLCYVKLEVEANGMFNTRDPAVTSAFPTPKWQLESRGVNAFYGALGL